MCPECTVSHITVQKIPEIGGNVSEKTHYLLFIHCLKGLLRSFISPLYSGEPGWKNWYCFFFGGINPYPIIMGETNAWSISTCLISAFPPMHTSPAHTPGKILKNCKRQPRHRVSDHRTESFTESLWWRQLSIGWGWLAYFPIVSLLGVFHLN